jgi:glutamate-ammonia-ligase adenylyltransferase
MEIPTLVSVLDHPHLAADHLHAWNLRDAHRGQQTLLELADCGLTLDLLANLCDQLSRHLPDLPDPDAVLTAFRQFLFASRSPLALGALFERDPSALPMLLRALALGERWRNLLVADPEAFDRLRMTGGQPLARAAMVGDACEEIASLGDERSVASALGRIRDREQLWIAYGELFCRHKFELVAEQLTYLSESLMEAALQAAIAPLVQKGLDPPRIAVIAFNRLGGAEADFGDQLELLLLHEAGGSSESARRTVHEQAERIAKQLVRLLSEGSGRGPLFRLKLVSLPDSSATSITHPADDVLLGYDNFGRTWHRQALLKSRPIAGDIGLAAAVLDRLQPWIFRRYLNRADETGIKALGRRLLRQVAAEDSGHGALNVESSRGALFDLEGAVQFLQLLAGGEQPGVRQRGTLGAIAALEQAAILTVSQRTQLEDAYVWLRRMLHRIQIACRSDTTVLPADEAALESVARSLDLADAAALTHEFRRRTSRVWEVLSQLVQEALPDEPQSPAVDLLLDPAPSAADAAAVFAGYGFRNPEAAATAMHELAREHISFLSTRRCRHFLALIAERLLQAVGATPDPDRTLVDLVRVSNSLGGKGVLWELFSFHPASLQLYVRLCAASPYLSGILTTNPGMIDDLVDSLQLDRLPAREELDRAMTELSRGATDTLPIVHDLKNSAHLRIGVRDILGKEPIDATHAALADVAEFCLYHVIEREMAQLTEKHGQPALGPGPFEGELCRAVVLGLGKLGAGEPNYHSNIEVAFLYEGDGTTRQAPRSRQQATTNNHFFSLLAQRVLKEAKQLTPKGRLATVDVVLWPPGVSGSLAMPLADFANYFASGAAPLGQWQALCQARPVFGDRTIQAALANTVQQLLTARVTQPNERQAIYRARIELERGAAELNLKRAAGGTLDIEFLVQALQLECARGAPAVLVPGTQVALAALAQAGALSADDAQYFAESYRFLRRIESGLRLLNTPARHDLPEDELSLDKLALLLGQPNGATIRDRAIITLAENRRRFERIMNREHKPGALGAGGRAERAGGFVW